MISTTPSFLTMSVTSGDGKRRKIFHLPKSGSIFKAIIICSPASALSHISRKTYFVVFNFLPSTLSVFETAQLTLTLEEIEKVFNQRHVFTLLRVGENVGKRSKQDDLADKTVGIVPRNEAGRMM